MDPFSARCRPLLVTARLSGVLAACICSPILASATAVNVCDPQMMQYRAALDRSITVRGSERPMLPVPLPAASQVIVLATERGIDVTLELLDASGQSVGRADSPIPRLGTQTIALRTVRAGNYTVVLNSKDGEQLSGEVRLRLIVLPLSMAADACVELHSRIANADNAYANGLVASRQVGLSPRGAHTPGPNAAQNSKSAAATYAALADRLTAEQPGSRLLALLEHAAAEVYYTDLSDWPVARALADRAAVDYQSNRDAYEHARALAISAAAQMEMAVSLPAPQGSAPRARPSSLALGAARQQLARLAHFHAARSEVNEQAQAINNIGLAFYYEGRNDEAISEYQRALLLYRTQPDKVRIAQVLNNIALAEYTEGHSARAAQRYGEALSNLSASETPQPHAFVTYNLGLTHFELGNYDAALHEFSLSLEQWRAAQNVREQAHCLQWIGGVYDAVGDQEQALDYYRAALNLRDGKLDPRGRVTSLRTMASLVRRRGDAAGALGLHEEALTMAATPAMRARLLVQVAMDLEALGRSGEALERLQAALDVPAVDEVSRAMLLLERARAMLAAGQHRGSERDLRAALAIFRDYDLTGLEFDSWLTLASAQRAGGNEAEALLSIDRALACAELLRVQSANPELRATLLQPLRPAYDLKISVLAEQYFRQREVRAGSSLWEALATAELSRARALDDFATLELNSHAVPEALRRQRSEVLRTLASERDQLEARLERVAVDDVRVASLRSGIAEGRRQLAQIDAQLGALAGGRSVAGKLSGHSLAALARQLPRDVAVVEYWLGATQSYAWVLSRDSATMTRLGPAAAIDQAAVEFHAGLRAIATRTTTDRLQLSAALYQRILQPIAPYLVGKRNIVVAPDGALHYVSFAALRAGLTKADRFLIQDHDIAVIPSVAMYNRVDRAVTVAPIGKQLLLVTDPVYQVADNRLGVREHVARTVPVKFTLATSPLREAIAGGDLQRLPGTAAEGRAIAALLPAGSFDVLEGLEATRARFLAAPLERYRIIHIATHGLVDTQIPQLSSLVLSTRDDKGQAIDGRVMAADFLSLRLNADVVVLSACDTALGRNVVGEGLIGLRYMILARGARAVVASLWPVSDQIGGRLMSGFYRATIRDHKQLSNALGSAMRELLAENVVDPALWAAFDLTLKGSRS